MRGKIVKWIGKLNQGFILGDDGREYFLHGSEVTNTKHIKKGIIVRFDFREEENKKNPRAINVRKTGHGTAHPFIHDLENIKKTIMNSNDSEKQYRLRDIEMLVKYFETIEDFEEYPEIRKTFRTGLWELAESPIGSAEDKE